MATKGKENKRKVRRPTQTNERDKEGEEELAARFKLLTLLLVFDDWEEKDRSHVNVWPSSSAESVAKPKYLVTREPHDNGCVTTRIDREKNLQTPSM